MQGNLVLGGRDSVTLAIAQVSPVYLDKAASAQRAVAVIAEAAHGGADLVVFPETWLAGYPYWTEGWDAPLDKWAETRVRFYDAAVVYDDDTCAQIGRAARKHRIHVVMGVNELDDSSGSKTIYNTQLFFDRNGVLYGRHRKLMPTYIERVFWGNGDGRDIQVYETDIGRVGGLICGEHLMPPIRGAMVSLGEDIHVAAFPGAFALHCGPQLESPDVGGDFWGHASVRNHAFESGSFVLAACATLDPLDVPDDFPFRDELNISYATGGSSIISPLGVPLVEPTTGNTILYAECQAWMIKATKAIVDAGGHYSRPDVVRIQIRREHGWEPVVSPRKRRSELERAADAHEVEIDRVLEVAELEPARARILGQGG